MADSIGSLNIKVGVDAGPAEAGFRHLTGELRLFTRGVEGVRPAGLRHTAADLRATATAADRATAAVGGLAAKLKEVAGAAVAGGVAGVAAGLTGGLASLGAGTLQEVVGGSLDLAGRAEASAMAFEVLTGSAERAREVLRDVRSYAAGSPFGVDGVTKATRGLIAYGLANQKAVPTVRMLGDIAAASGDRAGETLDRLVLAYGQVFTAGRLTGEELRQFTEAGVPVVDELAKVLKRPKAEIKALAEQGKIGFADVARAFRGMTAAGGRFAGMSERYADTFQGTVDRLKDGADDLKREFGVALIEELGLKDAAKDGERFAADMKRLVADLRPGIRFVGDLGRGLAQVLGEGIRNAPLFGQVFGDALRRGSPELAAYADRAQDLITGLKEFKLDPAKVVEFAADIGVTLARAADVLVKKLRDGLGGVYTDHVKPILDALSEAATTWGRIKGVLDSALDAVDTLTRKDKIERMRAAGQVPEQKAFLRQRLEADQFTLAADQVLQFTAYKRAELGRLPDSADKREQVGRLSELEAKLKEARDLRQMMHVSDFWEKYSADMTEVKEARENFVKREAGSASLLRDSLIPMAKRLGMTGPVRVNGVDLMAGGATGPTARLGPVEQSAQQLRDEILQPVLDRLNADRRAAASSRGVFGLDFRNAGSSVASLAAGAKKAADSLLVLADADVPAAVAAFAAPQLPPVAEFGTAEFNRLAGQAMFQPADTVEGLLGRLVGLGEDQLDVLRTGLTAPTPVRLPD